MAGSIPISQQVAYDKGCQAYRDGLSINPYPRMTKEYTSWDRGFVRAEHDAKRKVL